MEKQTMGAFISALRKSKGITQKELADMLSVSDKAVSRWECDQTVPDISLLPLIADIFEITVDELIRGGRIKNEQPTENQEKNIQKRLEAILNTKLSSYKIKSIIPIVLVIVGIILGFICKSVGYYLVGYGVSLLLFVFALALEVIFTLSFNNSIITSDLQSDSIQKFKIKGFNFSFLAFTSLLSIEALIISIDWLHFFIWSGPALAIAIFLVGALIKNIIVKKSNMEFPEKQNANLFFKLFVIFFCIIGVLVASMITINVNCDSWIERPIVFYVTDSTEEIENYLKEHIGNYIDEFGGNETEAKEDFTVKILDEEHEIYFSPYIKDQSFVNYYDYDKIEKDGQECYRVKIKTYDTYLKGRSIMDSINVAYAIVYIILVITAIGIYIKKKSR